MYPIFFIRRFKIFDYDNGHTISINSNAGITWNNKGMVLDTGLLRILAKNALDKLLEEYSNSDVKDSSDRKSKIEKGLTNF